MASLVSLFLIGFFFPHIFQFNFESAIASELSTSVTLDEFLKGKLSPKSFNGTWLNDNEILYNAATGNLTIFRLNNSSKVTFPVIHGYQISPNRKYLLIASNRQKLYRHSFLAEYSIVNLETYEETLLNVSTSNLHQLATWTSHKNGIVIINSDNLFYWPDVRRLNIYYQITTNGGNGIYNGRPDWVYEEEIFSSNKALWFSPSGQKMAFGYFNDTLINVFNVPLYGVSGANTSFQYPRSNYIFYPKSGTRNPIVKVYYVDLEMVEKSDGNNISLREIESPRQIDEFDKILAAVVFPSENTVSVTWMNRVQNHAYIHLYDVQESIYKTVFEYQEPGGWLKPGHPPKFSKDGRKFLMIHPQKQLDDDHWYHLVMVTINITSSSPIIRSLTFGMFDVTSIVGWDEEKSVVYYLASVVDDPTQQHFYRVSTLENHSTSECLSCNIKSENKGMPCLYNGASLSPLKNRFVLTCSGPDVPDISIYNSNDSSKLFTWENNGRITNLIEKKKMPRIKRLRVSIPGDFNATVQLFIPADANLNGSKKYPMLVEVYAGPDSIKITEKFSINWGTYLVTNKSFIYAYIDGRGSKLRGSRMLFAGYKNLGTVEIYDQINVTRYLQNKYSFIDENKTAIWGWSYGGYATGMSLALDEYNVFKCGISVAPVSSWHLYDSIYTERYMGLPVATDNKNGYEQGNLINRAENIKSNSYYLIHGTSDDNVHYQHSLLFAKQLERNDILFRQQTYTDESHGIDGLLPHLYHSLENFLDDCLIKY